MKSFIILASIFILSVAHARSNPPILLERATIDSKDQAQIERGANFFSHYCLQCHSLKYLGRDPIAQKAGITLDKMPLKDQAWWFGVAPPDLSLIVKVRGVNWIATYLHSFYQDKNNRLGSNNLLAHDTAMPNPFGALQGIQILLVDEKAILQHQLPGDTHYYNILRRETQGSMTPAEFEQMINDIVNFLNYASEPYQSERERMGYWVLGFLFILAVLAYLLYKAYWREVK